MDMLLQPDKSDFILAIIKEVESYEARNHWTIMKTSKVKNKHKMKIGRSRLLSIYYFKHKRSPYGILMIHKARICAHGGMQQ